MEARIIVVFTQRELITKIPMQNIINVYAGVVTMTPNSPDYLVIRKGAEELAPAGPAINLNGAVITFE